MPATIIAFFTGKGGTGKTSSVINLIQCFKNKGLKNLIIDTDT